MYVYLKDLSFRLSLVGCSFILRSKKTYEGRRNVKDVIFVFYKIGESDFGFSG